MIELSPELVNASRYTKRRNDHQRMVIFFDGPVPTKADIKLKDEDGTITNIAGRIRSSNFVTWAGSTGRNLLGYCRVDVKITAKYLADKKVSIPFSSNSFEMVVLAEGTPTWFVMFQGNSASFTTPTANADCPHMILGTFSDIAGAGEMKMGDGTLKFGQIYKLNDFLTEEI